METSSSLATGSKPRTLILRTAGTNCDRELAHAFTLAGAEPITVHLNELIAEPQKLDEFQILGFPGGFSYGDDIAAGRILANRLRHRLLEPLQAAVERGVPMIGICNGFQVLVKMGLLPDPKLAEQTTTLANNAPSPDHQHAGKTGFVDRWVDMVPDAASKCIWTKNLPEAFQLPIAHGEGRFLTRDEAALAQLREHNQIALRYATDDNPNGSFEDIAGICDPSGLVFGLMPHPERYLHPTNHPQWTRLIENREETTPGLRFFQNAVDFVNKRMASEQVSTLSESAI